MRKRDAMGLRLGPVFLRVALAAMFIWSGYGKIGFDQEYTGNAAATLANMGVIGGPASALPAPDETPQLPDAVPDAPAEPVPDDAAGESVHAPHTQGAFLLARQTPAPTYIGADFVNPIDASRVHTVTLMIKRASENGHWPGFASSDKVIPLIAWTICVGELTLGVLLLLGFFTRIAALGIFLLSAGALAYTIFIPALNSGDAFLWVLPAPQFTDSTAWVDAWEPWLLQFFATMTALSLVFSGPGALSLDALLLRPRTRSDADSNHSDDD